MRAGQRLFFSYQNLYHRPMSKTDTYKQCVLQRGAEIQVSWLPTKFAVKMKKLKLRYSNGEWEDGWIVIRVCGTLPAAQVEGDMYRHVRLTLDHHELADNWR